MKITLIDVPINYGCDRKGVDLAFNKLEDAGLLKLVKKRHNLVKIEKIIIPIKDNSSKYLDNIDMKYLKTILKVSNKLAEIVYTNLSQGIFPITIGGDHSIAIGSVAGASKYYENMAIIWIDAHADLNTDKTSLSHNIHGMPLAISLNEGETSLCNTLYKGQKVKPENIYHIGARDVELAEILLANRLSLNLYDSETIKKQGLENTIKTIIEDLKSKAFDGVHLSFDIDVMDARLVPGTGTSVADGLSMAEIEFILSSLLSTKLITSIDFVEYNPLLDDQDQKTLKYSLEIFNIILKHI